MKQIYQDIEADKAEMLDFTLKMAKINSGSYNPQGIRQVCEVIETKFKQELICESKITELGSFTGIDDQGEEQSIPLGPLLQISARLDRPLKVLLVGHTDTVYEPSHSFQEITDLGNGKINGPGVTDMKGGIAVILYALKHFEKLDIAKNIGWEVFLNPDEEIGSYGSLPTLFSRCEDFTLGLGFEPATKEDGTMASDRKGSVNLVLVMNGKAAHAGRDFHKGRNAITSLSKIITQIDSLNENTNNTTINIGMINGGVATNVVPERCVVRINARIETVEAGSWLQQEIENLVSDFNTSHPDFKLCLYGEITKQPKIVIGNPKMEKLYAFVKSQGAKLGHKIEYIPTGGCCDGNNMATAGLANVDTLGVRGGSIHSSDEYLIKDSLPERAQLLTAILIELATNGY